MCYQPGVEGVKDEAPSTPLVVRQSSYLGLGVTGGVIGRSTEVGAVEGTRSASRVSVPRSLGFREVMAQLNVAPLHHLVDCFLVLGHVHRDVLKLPMKNRITQTVVDRF